MIYMYVFGVNICRWDNLLVFAILSNKCVTLLKYLLLRILINLYAHKLEFLILNDTKFSTLSKYED